MDADDLSAAQNVMEVLKWLIIIGFGLVVSHIFLGWPSLGASHPVHDVCAEDGCPRWRDEPSHFCPTHTRIEDRARSGGTAQNVISDKPDLDSDSGDGPGPLHRL